ncbi:hypothetical protein M0R45_013654 [Rubus argutus]|uniref:Uncharacterized protein n=1 Tax=Rubus argutus TaxID=59490 RepID=A0AAW1XKF2_RUBAR
MSLAWDLCRDAVVSAVPSFGCPEEEIHGVSAGFIELVTAVNHGQSKSERLSRSGDLETRLCDDDAVNLVVKNRERKRGGPVEVVTAWAASMGGLELGPTVEVVNAMWMPRSAWAEKDSCSRWLESSWELEKAVASGLCYCVAEFHGWAVQRRQRWSFGCP